MNEVIQNKINTQTNGKLVYRLISNYTNNKDRMSFLHTECGRTFEKATNDLLKQIKANKCACNHCAKEDNKLSFDEIKETLSKSEFQLLTSKEDYINSYSPIKVKHRNCEEYETTYKNLFGKKKVKEFCRFCTPTKKFTLEEVKDIIGEDFLILEEYKNDKLPFLVRHTVCGKDFGMLLNNFRFNNSSCPNCFEKSKSETIISTILTENNIVFEREKRFKDCRYKNTLPFDFYIKNNNGKEFLIEFNGEQHYKGWNGTKSEESKIKFEEQLVRDKIKEKFCEEDDNKELFIIKYDENLEDAMKVILEKLVI